jgi:hypothetical protein
MCGVEASMDGRRDLQRQEPQMLLLWYLLHSLPAWVVIILICSLIIGFLDRGK